MNAEKQFATLGTGFPAAVAKTVVTKGYVHQTMMKALHQNPASILRAFSAPEYSVELQRIYNKVAGKYHSLHFSKSSI